MSNNFPSMYQVFKRSLGIFSLTVLAACGGGGGSSSGSAPVANSGVLYDAPLANVGYDGSFPGSTDNTGAFQYAAGDSLVFKLGNFSFSAVTPGALVGLTDLLQATELDNRVINLARLLQSLDTDLSDDIISLPASIDVDLSALDFSLSLEDFEADATVQALLMQHGNQTNPLVLIDVQAAVDHLYSSAQTLGVTLPLVSSALDNDGDKLLDSADTDDDNDGVLDTEDDFPFDASETIDTDGDGTGNNADPDDDNDGVLDTEDDLPFDATETIDTDGDGTGNNADTDDDNDGVLDTEDDLPFDATETVDSDGDGIGDNADAFDNDPNETTDTDGDGTGDNADAFDNDPNETTDTDGDEVGDNADVDDDNDGLIEISTLQQLDWVRNNLAGTARDDGTNSSNAGCNVQTDCIGYELTTDLDFDTNGDAAMNSGDSYYDYDGDESNSGWLPIGTLASRFTGIFEGNGFEVRNLYINRPLGDAETSGLYIGLFGYIDGAELRNIGVAGELASIVGDDYVGGLVGIANSSTVTSSYTTGAVTGGDYYVGGLVGIAISTTVTSSYATGAVTGGDNFVGGLVGYASSTTVTSSYATGAVMGDYYVGGLVGYADSTTVTSSYATGAVTGGDNFVGGLVGFASSSTVTSSYATGAVIGDTRVGGLVGSAYSTTVTSSYASGAVTGGDYVGGLVGRATSSTVTSSHATGAVVGNSSVGGVIGYANDSSFASLYWATDGSGLSDGLGYDNGNNSGLNLLVGVTLNELKCPTMANDTACVSGETLYQGWDAIDHDLDVNTAPISPWGFGGSNSLPILDVNGTAPIQGVAVSLVVDAPLTATAGESFDGSVQFFDAFNNAVGDAVVHGELSTQSESGVPQALSFNGLNFSVTPLVSGSNFLNFFADGNPVGQTYTLQVEPGVASALQSSITFEAPIIQNAEEVTVVVNLQLRDIFGNSLQGTSDLQNLSLTTSSGDLSEGILASGNGIYTWILTLPRANPVTSLNGIVNGEPMLEYPINLADFGEVITD